MQGRTSGDQGRVSTVEWQEQRKSEEIVGRRLEKLQSDAKDLSGFEN